MGNCLLKMTKFRMHQKGCRHENGYWSPDCDDPTINVHQCAYCHANDRALRKANQVAQELGLPP